jgi:hypothetical protein
MELILVSIQRNYIPEFGDVVTKCKHLDYFFKISRVEFNRRVEDKQMR